jgi:NTP pyrophosphatase (non-canonical NTP hydrolase)
VTTLGAGARNSDGRNEHKDNDVIDNQKLAHLLRSFAVERDWDQFHTPKNLASSLSVEAGELLELFQWSRGQKVWDDVADPAIRTKVEHELADILLTVIRFADKAGINLQEIAERKLELNAKKYPADKFRGSDRKYDE